MADSQRLQRALSILVNNAVKFTQTGGVRVRVNAVQTAGSEAATLSIEVADTGIGISPEMQQKIFTPFLQADSSTTRLYGGLGLGLALCKRIVNLMRGEIAVESEPGKGSVFRIMFPVKVISLSESAT
jgi:signal transduction histidine kinase